MSFWKAVEVQASAQSYQTACSSGNAGLGSRCQIRKGNLVNLHQPGSGGPSPGTCAGPIGVRRTFRVHLQKIQGLFSTLVDAAKCRVVQLLVQTVRWLLPKSTDAYGTQSSNFGQTNTPSVSSVVAATPWVLSSCLCAFSLPSRQKPSRDGSLLRSRPGVGNLLEMGLAEDRG